MRCKLSLKATDDKQEFSVRSIIEKSREKKTENARKLGFLCEQNWAITQFLPTKEKICMYKKLTGTWDNRMEIRKREQCYRNPCL